VRLTEQLALATAALAVGGGAVCGSYALGERAGKEEVSAEALSPQFQPFMQRTGRRILQIANAHPNVADIEGTERKNAVDITLEFQKNPDGKIEANEPAYQVTVTMLNKDGVYKPDTTLEVAILDRTNEDRSSGEAHEQILLYNEGSYWSGDYDFYRHGKEVCVTTSNSEVCERGGNSLANAPRIMKAARRLLANALSLPVSRRY